MDDVIFEILKTAVVLAVVLITRYAIPWLRLQVDNTKYKWLLQWTELAVKSAEQTIFGTDTSNADRKAIVTEFLKKQLIDKKISLSEEQLDTLIEAAVYTLNQEQAQYILPELISDVSTENE